MPAQKKHLPGDAFQTFQIDAAAGQQIFIFLREVVADHRHDARLRKITGGERDVRRRSSEHSFDAAVRRFDPIVGDRAHNYK